MISEFEEAILTVDVPEYGLAQGDIGTVVDIDKTAQQLVLEFFSPDGKTLAVLPLAITAVRPMDNDHARP